MQQNSVKCKNYYLCGVVLPDWWSETKYSDLCMNCDLMGFYDLKFKIRTNESCQLCFETNEILLQFPANCGHWFCVDCSSEILLCDKSRYCLSPVLYGCLPCPNGCVNPIKGKQCHCDEYDDVLELWYIHHREDFEKWDESQNSSIQNSKIKSKLEFCPLCFKHIY